VKGGSRVRSGRPPDPNALRRDRPGDRVEWLALPAAGRPGPPPAWPLIRPTSRELVLWAREWQRPQAVAWEVNGQELEVAVYVRTFGEAEVRGASVARRRLVHQCLDSLGITIGGLRANRWVIADAEDLEERPAAPPQPDAKERFRLLCAPDNA
jgi:hypothetical protein